MRRKIEIEWSPAEDSWIARVPSLAPCAAPGHTAVEALRNVIELALCVEKFVLERCALCKQPRAKNEMGDDVCLLCQREAARMAGF